MFGWRRLIAAFVGGLVVCAAVRADMVPVSQLDAEPRHSQQPCSRGELPRTASASLFGSLSLCLSALLGLGLCSFAHCVKKSSFGFILEWYRNGGPFQIWRYTG